MVPGFELVRERAETGMFHARSRSCWRSLSVSFMRSRKSAKEEVDPAREDDLLPPLCAGDCL